ncbi:hypothetical protein QJS10_CPA09g00676 [Acorus calamus]|uniref:Uncharacterized protein n=1 Tax=Acorus calamus TaxID=4465 RepID=A0AAV9E663_ACOCL|nr:hypothetical protein QJS10_CPA09g00676 [Acorus calamus]
MSLVSPPPPFLSLTSRNPPQAPLGYPHPRTVATTTTRRAPLSATLLGNVWAWLAKWETFGLQ